MNISREIKQEISLNYALSKSENIIKKLEDNTNSLFLKTRERILEIENKSQSDIELFCANIKKLNPKFSKFLQHGQVNGNQSFNSRIEVKSYDNKISITNYFQKSVFPEHDFDYLPTSIINEDFKCAKNGILEKDSIAIEIREQHFEIQCKLIKEIQTFYDNLYELIRNVRTLERIEKNFPDVHKYLPVDFKESITKEKPDLKDSFSKL